MNERVRATSSRPPTASRGERADAPGTNVAPLCSLPTRKGAPSRSKAASRSDGRLRCVRCGTRTPIVFNAAGRRLCPDCWRGIPARRKVWHPRIQTPEAFR